MQAKLDKWLGKWASRKLIVFGIATWLCLSGNVVSSDWVYLAIVYIGTQGAVDIFTKIKG